MSRVFKPLLGLRITLLLSLAITGVFAMGATTALPSQDCAPLLVRSLDRQALRTQFNIEFAEKIYASKERNEAYIKLAIEEQTAASRTFFVVENAWMKRLNDEILKDKDLVTSLTNLHKEIFLKTLGTHPSGINQNLLAGYSDFKSLRGVIAGPAQVTEALLKEVFESANRQFYAHPILAEILRAEDLNNEWFAMGLGNSNDQASLAAKGARKRVSLIQSFSEATFQQVQNANRVEIQILHRQLTDKFTGTAMVQGSELALNTYAHARKAHSDSELLAKLKTEYQIDSLELKDAKAIDRLVDLIDGFTPSMLIAGRETLTLHNAVYGAISIDFIGLGAENLKATARAMIESRNLNGALALARKEEQLVTIDFHRRQDFVRKTVDEFFEGNASVKFSGDDGIIIPQSEFSLEDQLHFMRALTQDLDEPLFRVTFIGSSAAQSDVSSEMITHAESIEKLLRPRLQTSLGSAVARQIHILIFNPDIEENRSVFLVLRINAEISVEDKLKLRLAFRESVKHFEAQLKAMGQQISYDDAEVFNTSPDTQRAVGF